MNFAKCPNRILTFLDYIKNFDKEKDLLKYLNKKAEVDTPPPVYSKLDDFTITPETIFNSSNPV